MNIAITFRQMETTEALKTYIHERLQKKLEKFIKEPAEIQVHLSVERYLHCAEFHLHSKKFTAHCEEKSDDMYGSIDAAIDSLEKTARRHKEKLNDSKTNA